MCLNLKKGAFMPGELANAQSLIHEVESPGFQQMVKDLTVLKKEERTTW
jgi:hypothetical protein